MAIALATRRLAAGELLQHVSRVAYRGQRLHFGSDGTNRYDAPDGRYGVLYLGLALVLFVVYPILVKAHGLSIRQYFSGVWPAVQLAFVSRSSIGTLPQMCFGST